MEFYIEFFFGGGGWLFLCKIAYTRFIVSFPIILKTIFVKQFARSYWTHTTPRSMEESEVSDIFTYMAGGLFKVRLG